MKTVGILFLVVFSLVLECNGAVFTSGPAADLNNGKVRIAFSVSASTDVEVAIFGANGKIVRHLAAGVLGGAYAPPSPLADGLSQVLEWDGADDAGRPASGGPFSARVRLGLKPVYGFTIWTDSIPGSHRSGFTVPRLWEETVQLVNGIFNRILVEHSNPDLFVRVNDAKNEVYVHVTDAYLCDQYRYDGATGALLGAVKYQGIRERQYWGEIDFTWDGESMIHTTGLDEVVRYSRLGVPQAWPKAAPSDPDVFMVNGLQQGFTNARGHAVAPDGSVYVLHHHDHCGGIYTGDSVYKGGVVSQISPTGTVTRSEFIRIPEYVGGGIRVDRAGGIYVGVRKKLSGLKFPPALDTLLTNTGTGSLYWWADQMYGTLVKYDNSGAPVWEYFGQSPHLSKKEPPLGTHCICNAGRFDVDGFGRVFLNDAFRISVIVLDNNRNEILRFNHKKMPVGKLPPGWPHAVEVTDNAFYIADQMNDQVIAMNLSADTSVTLDLPVAVERGEGRVSLSFLFEARPNPFRRGVTFRYAAASPSERAVIRIFDVRGRLSARLTDGPGTPGAREVRWDAGGIEPGAYFARLDAGNRTLARRVLLSR